MVPNRSQPPLDQPAAKRLWLETLPAAAQQRLLALGNDQTDALFSKASAWACEKVIGRELCEQAIITRTAKGYEAHASKKGATRMINIVHS